MSEASILVVDDDPTIRLLLEKMLKHGGHAATAVSSAEIALDMLRDRSFDLIMLDLNMPGMSGHELIDALRSKYPDLPIIVVSADVNFANISKLFKKRVSGFLAKPIADVDVALDKVRACLEWSASRNSIRDRLQDVARTLDD